MELTIENYHTQTLKRTEIVSDSNSFVTITQRMALDGVTWEEPRMYTNRIRMMDNDGINAFKDALDMAAIIFAAWSEDTGKEIVE